MRGVGRLKNFARGVIGNQRRSAPVRTLHRLASFVESAYSNEGSDFESNGERRLLARLRAANIRVAFDVGANFGDWSETALSVWPGCHVHAFEVAPPTYERLSARLSNAPAGRLTLNALGLSNTTGTRQMYYFPDQPELTCDLPRHDGFKRVTFDGQLMAGDEYCDRHSVDGVDFLKIDVEGAEFAVLKGFSRRLADQRIPCVQFEYGAFAIQTRILLADFYALLGQSHWIGKIFPTYVDFRDYHWTMEEFRFSNYCCVSRARPDLRERLGA